MSIFIVRLFYIQVIKHNDYKIKALSDQLKQYQIPATRGLVYVQDSGQEVPLVLNQTLYTLYADPPLIKNSYKDAQQIAGIIGGNPSQYQSIMTTKNTQYVVLAKKLTAGQNSKVLSLLLPGIGTQSQDYRTYPQASIASQLLGFVNDQGQGEYGVEQALNKQLSGVPGSVKAVTDANGVPLAATKGNVEIAPKNGDNVDLTINLAIQSQVEQILANEYKSTKSQGISAIVMDPNNGQVVAMANYPTYDPANYQSVTDQTLFQNASDTNPIEIGSSMKTLTTSAALSLGVITPTTSFYDPAHWVVDGFNITDIEQDGGPRQQNIQSILSLSLNTGAVWLLMQMGGGQIDRQGILDWNNYMVNHFRLGQTTGIEQGYEASGYVPKADLSSPSIDLTYAETAFGQGIQITALQLISALSSVLNGGTYYQPTLVAQTVSPDGQVVVNKPKILERNVVKPSVSQAMIPLMEGVVTTYFHEGYNFMNFSPDYIVGGKTGTAQIALPGGGYDPNIYNGTYIGFVGGNKIQYLIDVFNTKPNVPGYAGALGGQPVFADIAHMLINEGFVQPISKK
jgi:cell division protein FtsI/penicillin-binding protein 2